MRLRVLTAAAAAWMVLFGGRTSPAYVCTANTVVAGPVTGDEIGNKIHGTNWSAQTFQVSSCAQLQQVTIEACKSGTPGNLVLEIHDASSGIPSPGATPLASATVAASSISAACRANASQPIVFGGLNVTFSPPPQLAAGSTAALVLHQENNGGTGSNFYRVGLRNSNPYPGGQYCRWNGASWDCGVFGGVDMVLSTCTTGCCAGCTYTQGYWKNHGGAWPVVGLTLGGVYYTEAQLLGILSTPPAGNGLLILAHQLIAARLNEANGACVPPSVAAALSSADSLINGLVIPPVGSGWLAPAAVGSLTCTLDKYNNGCINGGPGHCGGASTCPTCTE